MKIKGSRSYIIIEVGDKELKIEGELTTTPCFYAEADSIKNWKTPSGIQSISAAEKQEIILRIISESKDSKVPILFDGYS